MFTYIDDLERWLTPKFRGLVTHGHDHPAPHPVPSPTTPSGGLAAGRAQGPAE